MVSCGIFIVSGARQWVPEATNAVKTELSQPAVSYLLLCETVTNLTRPGYMTVDSPAWLNILDAAL